MILNVVRTETLNILISPETKPVSLHSFFCYSSVVLVLGEELEALLS